MDLNQVENYEFNATELKYSGFGDRLNGELQQKMHIPEDFRLYERQRFELAAKDTFADVELYPDFSFNAEKGMHYYNGVYAAIDRGIILPEKSSAINLKEFQYQISRPPQDVYNGENPAAFEEAKMAHKAVLSMGLQQVAEKDPALFHLLMAKFNPAVNFELTEADNAAVKKIREDAVLAQYFPRKERLSAIKMGYLLLGNFVHQVKYKDNVEMKGWIALELQPNEHGVVPRTENDNHFYKRFDEKYGYDPATVFAQYKFLESASKDKIDTMVSRIQRGEFVDVTPEGNSKHQALRVAADPTFKDFAIYDSKGTHISFTDHFKQEEFRRTHKRASGEDGVVTHRSSSAAKRSEGSGSSTDTHQPDLNKETDHKKKAGEEPVKRRQRNTAPKQQDGTGKRVDGKKQK